MFVLFSTGLFTVALLLTRPSGRKMTLVSREAQVEATPRAQNLTPIRIPRLLPSSVMGNIWQWCCNLTNHVVKKFLRWRLQKGGCKHPLSTIRRWKSVIVNKPVEAIRVLANSLNYYSVPSFEGLSRPLPHGAILCDSFSKQANYGRCLV